MRFEGFEQELKRLCTLLCGNEPWVLWADSRSFSMRIASSGMTDTGMEERVLLRQSFLAASGELPAGHALFQQPDMTGLFSAAASWRRFSIETTVVIFATTPALSAILAPLEQLAQERWREWGIRKQLSLFADRQQEQLQLQELRLHNLQTAWQQQVQRLIANWSATYYGLEITTDPDLAAAFAGTFDHEEITRQLTTAIEMERFLRPGATSIHLSALQLLPAEEMHPEPSVAPTLTHAQRAELLLDKYEEAARRAQRKNLAVNGKTIAEHLQPSISPPAITDALKKNRKPIGTLLQHFPDKWPLLRRFLKPVKELHERGFYQQLETPN